MYPSLDEAMESQDSVKNYGLKIHSGPVADL